MRAPNGERAAFGTLSEGDIQALKVITVPGNDAGVAAAVLLLLCYYATMLSCVLATVRVQAVAIWRSARTKDRARRNCSEGFGNREREGTCRRTNNRAWSPLTRLNDRQAAGEEEASVALTEDGLALMETIKEQVPIDGDCACPPSLHLDSGRCVSNGLKCMVSPLRRSFVSCAQES